MSSTTLSVAPAGRAASSTHPPVVSGATLFMPDSMLRAATSRRKPRPGTMRRAPGAKDLSDPPGVRAMPPAPVAVMPGNDGRSG